MNETSRRYPLRAGNPPDAPKQPDPSAAWSRALPRKLVAADLRRSVPAVTTR